MYTHLLPFNNLLRRPSFLGLLFILFFNNNAIASGPIKIAIIDTGFCLELIRTKLPSNIKITKIQDTTQSIKVDCSKLKLSERRLHGQLVLNKILEFGSSNKEKNFIIMPIIVFNNKAIQKLSYWEKALQLSKDSKLVIAAAGMKVKNLEQAKKLSQHLNPQTIYFFSSGQVSTNIKKDDKLFPQLFYKRKNVFLFGSYFPSLRPKLDKQKPIQIAQELLYKDSIDYFLPYYDRSNSKLMASSLAVALAAKSYLSYCLKEQKLYSVKECFSKHSHSRAFENRKVYLLEVP